MFFSNNTALYSAERRARCLAARTAHTDAHHFFLGTLSLREANEVQMLQFDEDTSELSKARSFAHPHEVWCIAASPADENLLATTYSDGGSFGAALWRLPASEGEGGSGSAEEMEQLQTLPCSPAENGRGNVRSVMWDPFTADEDDAQIAAVHERGVVVWKVGESDAPHAQLRLGEEAPIGAAAWDPHHPNELTVASGCAINSYDLRAVRRAVKKGAATDATVHSIANAHSAPVKDVDYNPNKPWNIVSAGDDSFIKVSCRCIARWTRLDCLHYCDVSKILTLDPRDPFSSLPTSPHLPPSLTPLFQLSSGTCEKQAHRSRSSTATRTG